MRRPTLAFFLIAGICASLQGAPQADVAKIQALLSQRNEAALKAMGPQVLPVLVQLYRGSDESRKARIAETLYRLGWKSAEANRR